MSDSQLPVRHRSTRWLRRKRRATFRRRTIRTVLASDPIIWAIFLLMVACAGMLGWIVVTVLREVR